MGSGADLNTDPISESEEWERKTLASLPANISPGEINLTLLLDYFGDPQAFDMAFTWDGGTSADWHNDISVTESISPGSSSPIVGTISWEDGKDLKVTYDWVEGEVAGQGGIPNAAPSPEELRNPRTWVQFTKQIHEFVLQRLSFAAPGENPRYRPNS